jgi:hypothetical protein
VVLGLEVLSVGSRGELVTCLNLGLLGGLPHQHVLGVQGAGEGSGASYLLLQVKLLVLSSVRVHLHDNPFGLFCFRSQSLRIALFLCKIYIIVLVKGITIYRLGS